MFALFSYAIHPTASRRTRIWLIGCNYVARFPWRRLVPRLLLLIVWSLLTISIIYQLSSQDSSDQRHEISTSKPLSESLQLSSYGVKLNKDNDVINRVVHRELANSVVSETNDSIVIPTKLPTKTASNFLRTSKIFILLMQTDRLFSAKPKPAKFAPNQKHQEFIDSKTRDFVVPEHIKILIKILVAHRIDFDIGTTRAGIPTALLNDPARDSSKQQYSVIVIDDFLKYTRSNRWLRDQLDRHCRLNSIGVISYFVQAELELPIRSDSILNRSNYFRNLFPRATAPGQDEVGLLSTTEESITDQFPISFRPLDKQSDCQDPGETCLVDYQLNERSPILRILKRRPNFILKGPVPKNLNEKPWISMASTHPTYQPLTWAKIRLGAKKTESLFKDENKSSRSNNRSHTTPGLSSNFNDFNSELDRQVLSMYDCGLFDGIKRVIFGGANHIWLNRILLLDAIEQLSLGKIFSPLDRYIQIDIDDIFVGEKGIRLKRSDVKSLIKIQNKFGKLFDNGFKFNLGFSGKYFKRGTEEENQGDEELVANAEKFTWFCHTWGHTKAHLFNDTESIRAELRKNLEFAHEYRLPLIGHASEETIGDKNPGKMPPTYAIAPHHSGVYPVHNQLYEAWRDVLNVQVTSTEEYPTLKPAEKRRAFVFKTIKVLPRQTCGLYTHTIYRDKYPGGMEKLTSSIDGGELFETVLHNPVNIYMTHMSNYANDRLALFTFEKLFHFIQENTNLILRYIPSGRLANPANITNTGSGHQSLQLGPAKLAEYYFNLFPNEREPLWTNPCQDKRHLAIWSQDKISNYCPVVPELLIVGPQKTGTTALYSFLKLNPIFKSSQISATDYEEIQFFNDKHYLNGVDWYFSKFLDGASNATESSINFDKSATYFDDPKVPARAAKLLPGAKIIILLIDPADRAYSWYQHIKAHGDSLANSKSFEEIIMSRERSDSPIGSFRQRCLHPGYYAQHLLRWLDYFQSNQIIIIDGQWFKYNPISVMNRLQLLLHLNREYILNYENLLVFSKSKGFYCEKSRNSRNGVLPRCLGKSKGRPYEPMSEEARLYLNKHYWLHNQQLSNILSNIGQALPTWLEESTTIVSKALSTFQK